MVIQSQETAAIIIQNAWRKRVDTQVFNYYKHLLSFSSKGSPANMLRCINPNEAKLLDDASGVHIRFRLMGEKFPPSICYKIYTHRPVQDICSNSPKDYTSLKAKHKHAKSQNNRINLTNTAKCSKAGWYERFENNGWRVVSSSQLQNTNFSNNESYKAVKFHHNNLRRKQDIQLNRKRKKIEWMKKMYKNGMHIYKSSDKNINDLVSQATEAIIDTYEVKGCKNIQDWEVDELLKWTNQLSFEDYQNDWSCKYTSKPSNKTGSLKEDYSNSANDRSSLFNNLVEESYENTNEINKAPMNSPR